MFLIYTHDKLMTMIKVFQFLQRITILAMLLIVLSACANVVGPVRVYSGEKRLNTEIVQFQIPSALEVVKLDGKELETHFTTDDYYLMEVLPGKHTMQVEYVELWGDATASFSATSKPFQFTIDTTAGSYYEFKHNGPDDLIEADSALVSDIRIWLEHPRSNQKIYANKSKVESSEVSQITQPVSSKNEEVNPAPAVKITPDTQGAQSTLSAEKVIYQEDALGRLKYWWEQAEESQRRAFVNRATVTETESTAVVNALDRLNFWWKSADAKQRDAFKKWIESL